MRRNTNTGVNVWLDYSYDSAVQKDTGALFTHVSQNLQNVSREADSYSESFAANCKETDLGSTKSFKQTSGIN